MPSEPAAPDWYSPGLNRVAYYRLATASAGARPRPARLRLARNFLDANAIDYRTTAATPELKVADVGDRAKKFTLLIECMR